jgi:hypothetical protein
MARIKHYKLRGRENSGQPSLLFEVRLEIYDVRSGYSGVDSGLYEGPWLASGEFDWTVDMVQPVAVDTIEEVTPPKEMNWPEDGDDRIIRHFVRFFRIPIWRNSELAIYSYPGQTRKGFQARCAALLLAERRKAVESVRDVFLRRFLELEARAFTYVDEHPWDPVPTERRNSEIRCLFSEIRESFSNCFLRESLDPISENDLSWTGEIDVETSDRLESLRAELVNQFNDINGLYREKSTRVESYEVPVNHSQIEVVSKGILWK